MVVNDICRTKRKESVVAYFKALYQHSYGRITEDHENLQGG
jgi:hypothetical protein